MCSTIGAFQCLATCPKQRFNALLAGKQDQELAAETT